MTVLLQWVLEAYTLPRVCTRGGEDIWREAASTGPSSGHWKDGWRITADPYIVRFDQTAVEIDLAAEQLLAAERAEQKIAVEVKSFLSPSRMYDFHLALGQFLTYRLAIAQHEPERTLYLAIPIDVHEQIFLGPMAQQIMSQYHVHVLVFDPIGEDIRTWGT